MLGGPCVVRDCGLTATCSVGSANVLFCLGHAAQFARRREQKLTIRYGKAHQSDGEPADGLRAAASARMDVLSGRPLL